ncbi:RNA-guided endonuclease InsQ/TnpB family protein [Clostridium botulinum]|nr:RNA-guided endonuclease TnpB family protein [Clostridium botulinum]EDT83790.1 putative transposase DNA-binding domain family [Clostridium botulinum Bf]MBY6881585.1 IS200/IS605 family element transposase accessory protein TnpB [Clostridium botulinum]WCJ75208.1 RNA-guided endonuclease TnpB family protein [Clostridium botulinum]WCJ79047.1 RNA-guided endonuclease TnpB family protein [Clostridium botulinum]WCJ82883.1 RNA-guided endonuclease TnpB family protein [Clostridium botulinum]
MVMEIVRTLKIKLNINQEEKNMINSTLEAFLKALNYASQVAFNNGEITNKPKLQKLVYDDLRTKFNLKSQMAVNTCTTVCSSYVTQHSNKVFNSLAVYKSPKAIYSYGRDYSFLNDGQTISINTIAKRIKVHFKVNNYFKKYLTKEWSFGSLEIVERENSYYAHITVSKEVQEKPLNEFKNIIGIDLGQNFIATFYDSKGKIKFFKGRYLKDMRAKYTRLRKQLQRKGTYNAHKKIVTINQREQRTMTYINHKISKEIVEYAKQNNAIIAMENLTGINLSCKVKKDNRYYRVSWAFNQLQQFIEYKAVQAGLKVIYINPKYTSQTCPICGHIHKDNRNKKLHIFKCRACGCTLNDDLIGAKNIQHKGYDEKVKLETA